jgi:cytochrome b involved in lipid metabolism
MMDLAGKNADEMFEDIGHSNEARKIMKTMEIGELKVRENKGVFI